MSDSINQAKAQLRRLMDEGKIRSYRVDVTSRDVESVLVEDVNGNESLFLQTRYFPVYKRFDADGPPEIVDYELRITQGPPELFEVRPPPEDDFDPKLERIFDNSRFVGYRYR